MTKTEALVRTAEMWDWIAEDYLRSKHDYFAEHNLPPVRNTCFACEYAAKFRPIHYCEYCPIEEWRKHICHKFLKTPYNLWRNEFIKGTPKASLYAKEIANLARRNLCSHIGKRISVRKEILAMQRHRYILKDKWHIATYAPRETNDSFIWKSVHSRPISAPKRDVLGSIHNYPIHKSNLSPLLYHLAIARGWRIPK